MLFWAKVKVAAAVIGGVVLAGTGGGLAARHLLAGESPAVSAVPTGPIPAATGGLILDEGSPWRMFAAWSTPLVRKGAELKEEDSSAEWGSKGFAARTAPPPVDWVQPDFFEGTWSRWSWNRERRREYDYGFTPAWGAPAPTLSLLCLRGKFFVPDPAGAGKLTLALAYRGGAVVYLNGKEIARASLPKDGQIEPRTLAEDYPPEAFVHDGPPERGSDCILAEFGHPAKYKDRLEKRIRKLENIAIDGKALRKGVNVLAVEVHRAPYFGTGLAREGSNHNSVWSTAGLVSLALRAEGGVAPNLSRPAGIQVGAWPEMRRPSPFDYATALEKAEPVIIVGCRNGAFNGRVMISSDQAFSGVKAQAGELRHKDGKGAIPAAAIRLFYTIRDDKMALRYAVPKDGFWDTLADEPPAKSEAVAGAGAAQSIILRVQIPADAVPGEYSGKLTVSADGLAATDVPVQLKVVGWNLPATRDFGTHMGVIQSPETIALQYKVPLWSEEHWKLVEESFKLLGELGNNYVVIPIVSRTNFGNEHSMIRWIRDGDKYKYDFTLFDRYLDLAQKYQKVDVVCLYAWEKYSGMVGFQSRGSADMPGGGLKVTLYDSATGKAEDLEGPKFSEPEEFNKFWAPVYKEVEARMAKRGLADATMLGIDSETARIPKKAVDALHALMPNAKWVSNPHADCRGTKVMGIIPVGYNTVYYASVCPPPGATDPNLDKRGAVNGRFYGWQSKSDYYGRGRGTTAPLSLWRVSVEAALVHTFSGLGRIGADFWPVTDSGVVRHGKKFTPTLGGRFPESCWDQLNLDRGTEAVFAPGPSGAVRTERSEQIRQNIQECQARIFIEKAILAKKLDPELAQKCQDVLDERTWNLRGLNAIGGAGCPLGGRMANVWYEGGGSAGVVEKLYVAAAEVAAKLGAK